MCFPSYVMLISDAQFCFSFTLMSQKKSQAQGTMANMNSSTSFCCYIGLFHKSQGRIPVAVQMSACLKFSVRSLLS